jgi:hypothetical protein
LRASPLFWPLQGAQTPIPIAAYGENNLSHIVEIQTQIRDPVAVQAACRRLGLPPPITETVQLFSGAETGLTLRLPGWQYPVICDTASGQLKYDNFEGHWGDRKKLDHFLQAYAIEKARLEARKRGHSVTEQQLDDGSIKLTIQVAGGAA